MIVVVIMVMVIVIIVAMVIVVIMMVMVQLMAGLKIALRANTLSQQHINRQFTHGGCHHLHAGARGAVESIDQSLGLGLLEQVGFVHHNHIGAGDLIFEKLR